MVSLFKSTTATTRRSDPDVQPKAAIEAELNTDFLSARTDNIADPHLWSKVQYVSFKKLSKMSYKHLCTPVTSIPSESSIRGNIATCQRVCLKTSTD